jgi:CTP:molybdopterin cytidylyltransferase MocA
VTNNFLSTIVLAAGLSRRMGKANKLLLPIQGATLLETTLDNILNARVGETLVVVGHEAAEVVTALCREPSALSSELSAISYQPQAVRHDLPEIKHELEGKTAVETSNFKFQTKKGPLSVKAIFGQKLRKNGQFFTILENPNYEIGMTTSIQTGVAAANDESVGFMICLSDMPFITPSDYQFLAEKFAEIVSKDPKAIVQPTFEGKRGNPTILSHFYKQDILDLTFTEGCKPIVQANATHVYAVEMPTDAVLKDIDTEEEYSGLRLGLKI